LSDKVKEEILLESEFTIEDMLVHPDLKGKTLLYNNAWRNNNNFSNYDLLIYEYNRESPCFNPKFDLSVVNKNGIHVASCVAFIDYKNNYAEIEKVCSHSEYRNRGLAEAVIRECFKRLFNEGIEYAYIGGSSNEAKNLYAKLGSFNSWNWIDYSLMEG
jgi:GNAT superfamily N-acetyltransferase